MKSQKYYSRAKLLITGEYLVLKGAKALAVPLKYGQSTEFFYTKNSTVFHWYSYEKGKLWFKAVFDSKNLSIIETSEENSANFIQKLLQAIQQLKPNLQFTKLLQIKNEIDFNRLWGLGTSSTLINNMAKWANLNPFELHFKISNGSAYDIACANANNPIIYTLNSQTPKYKSFKWQIPFKKQLYFVYLKNKQSSEKSINTFQKIKFKSEYIEKISQLSEQLLHIKKFEDFYTTLITHEHFISKILNIQTIKERLFPDFDGIAKSLGAWGGDFCLVASHKPTEYLTNYFTNKGYDTLINYSDIVYEQNN